MQVIMQLCKFNYINLRFVQVFLYLAFGTLKESEEFSTFKGSHNYGRERKIIREVKHLHYKIEKNSPNWCKIVNSSMLFISKPNVYTIYGY